MAAGRPVKPGLQSAIRAAGLLVLLVLALGPAAAGAADDRAVAIVDDGYRPRVVTIDQGQVVTWTNRGKTAHTVTSDRGKTLESGALAPGSAFATVFDRPGTYRYHCALHPEMQGTVIVRAVAQAETTTGPTGPCGTRPSGFRPGASTVQTTTTAAASDSGGGGGTSAWVWIVLGVGVGVAAGGLAFVFARRRASE